MVNVEFRQSPGEQGPGHNRQPPLPEPRTSDELPKRNKWRRKIGAIGLALSITTGISVAFGEYYANDPAAILHAAENTFEHSTPEIEPGEPSTLNYVRNIAAEYASKKELMLPYSSSRKNSQKYQEQVLETADRLGINLVSPEEYQQEIKQAETPSQVMQALSKYTAHFGFGVKLHKKLDPKDLLMDVAPLKNNDVDLDKLKDGALIMTHALMRLPVNLYKFADINQIRIVDKIGLKNNPAIGQFDPAGKINYVSGIIYIPISTFYGSDTTIYFHEIGHRVDYESVGLLNDTYDPAYTRLASKNFHYGHCADKAIVLFNVAQQYSCTNLAEDKATMFGNMLGGIDPKLLYDRSKVVGQKYRLLLARLEAKIPGITEYLFAISLLEPRADK